MSLPNQEEEIIKNPERDLSLYSQEDFVPEYVKRGINPIPQDYPSLDGELIESNMPNAHIIDNNEYVSFDFGIKAQQNKKMNNSIPDIPDINEFVLMVDGKVVNHGPADAILAEAKAILYGQHLKFKQEVKIDDIILLKRVGLKIGVFLDE